LQFDPVEALVAPDLLPIRPGHPTGRNSLIVADRLLHFRLQSILWHLLIAAPKELIGTLGLWLRLLLLLLILCGVQES
jgi:uncharacterized membrane protein